MKALFRKIRICLFEPKKMGFYIGEKLYKSLLQLLLFSLIVIIPIIVEVSIQDTIGKGSYNAISEKLMFHDDENLKLVDGKLTGSESFDFMIEEALVFINPLDQELVYSASEYAYFPVVEFKSDRVIVTVLNAEFLNVEYSLLNAKDVDFNKIANKDYVELDKFVDLVNVVFNYMRPVWIGANVVINLLEAYLMAVVSALVLAFFMGLFHINLQFKYRFKIALDAQFINLAFILLSILFNFEYITYLGMIFTAVYVTKAFAALVRIEVRRVPKEEGDE